MRSFEDRLIGILKTNSVDFMSTFPCDRIKFLLERVKKEFFHIPLTREEEGVGIAAGIALAGKKTCHVRPELGYWQYDHRSFITDRLL